MPSWLSNTSQPDSIRPETPRLRRVRNFRRLIWNFGHVRRSSRRSLSSCAGGSVRYQPVMIERSSLIGPAARIIRMWMTKKPTSSSMTMKWMVRAVCRPPSSSCRNGSTESHARRHRQAGDDHQRQQDEQHAAIGHLLQRVVVARVVELQPGVVDDVARQPPEIVDARHEVAPEMAVDQRWRPARRAASRPASRRRRNGRRARCRGHGRTGSSPRPGSRVTSAWPAGPDSRARRWCRSVGPKISV